VRSLVLLLPIVAIACGSSAGVENPTGDCKANGKGNRVGYDGEPVGAVWLPDCQKPVAREYWRVFAQSSTSAYMLPRPDGEANLVAVCGNVAHPLHAMVESYLLCSAATSEASVARVNSMLPADALQIAHYLHTVFAFENDSRAGVHIAPFPITDDILEACALHAQDNSTEFTAICTREQDRLQSGNDIGFKYDGPGAVELVARLNELYGISCSAGLIPVTTCTCGPADGCAELNRVCRAPCQSNADCLDPGFPTCANGTCTQPCG
jgi:hypothetical protein